MRNYPLIVMLVFLVFPEGIWAQTTEWVRKIDKNGKTGPAGIRKILQERGGKAESQAESARSFPLSQEGMNHFSGKESVWLIVQIEKDSIGEIVEGAVLVAPEKNEYRHVLTMSRRTSPPNLLRAFSVTAGAKEPKLPRLRHKTSVKEAYRLIPHRRTLFDFKESRVKEDKEVAYLKKAFALIEEAMRCRVITLKDYLKKAPRSEGKARRHMKKLLDYWGKVKAPEALEAYHQHIKNTLTLQIAFFKEWEDAGEGYAFGAAKALRNHPKVRQASKELISAYNLFLRRYGQEGKKNKQAFFDYHCAFDFI